MSDIIEIVRHPSTASPLSGASLAGAARVDITPHFDMPMAGYSTMAGYGRGRRGRLYVRCLYLQQDDNRRVALCVLDQMSASRYLLEAIAVRTVKLCGISVDRLVLAGTHTHTAPGNFYGNSLYDALANSEIGFDEAYANWLSDHAAACIATAVESARPAVVGYGQSVLWGVARNRSPGAFYRNFNGSPALWFAPGAPGESVPPPLRQAGQTDDRSLIDPRVRVLAAFEEDGRALIGALATFGCHPTTVPRKTELYSSDWPGSAQDSLNRSLPAADKDGVIAIGISGGGDITAADPAYYQKQDYFGRADEVGEAVSQAVQTALTTARAGATAITVDCSFAEISVGLGAERLVNRDSTTELGRDWAFGVPTIGGSEESRSDFYRMGLAREPWLDPQSFPNDLPQRPKVKALGILQGALRFLLDVSPSPLWPIHNLSVSGTRIVTVPGEPTAFAAWEIERACSQSTGERVMPLGWAGDYNGYFTTAKEYWAQHYEGSSTLWGQYSTNHLAARLRRLGGSTPPLVTGPIRFEITATESNFDPHMKPLDPRRIHPQVLRFPDRTMVSWYMPKSARLVAGTDWFARVEQQDAQGSWNPVMAARGPLDDRHLDMVLRRYHEDSDWQTRDWFWSAEFPTQEAGQHKQVVLRSSADGRFPGFVFAL